MFTIAYKQDELTVLFWWGWKSPPIKIDFHILTLELFKLIINAFPIFDNLKVVFNRQILKQLNTLEICAYLFFFFLHSIAFFLAKIRHCTILRHISYFFLPFLFVCVLIYQIYFYVFFILLQRFLQYLYFYIFTIL